MGYLLIRSNILIVCLVASSHNLIGDGQSCWEGIIHGVIVVIWIYIHITTVSTAVERADGTVAEPLTPPNHTLEVHLYWLEVEVDEVRIDAWAILGFRRQIKFVDTLVGWVARPVDGVGEVEFLGGIIDATVQSLELTHEVVVLGCREEGIAIAAHEDTSDFHMATDVNIYGT